LKAPALTDVRLEFISGQHIPVSSVGVFYNEPSELAGCLSEIVSNYDHYLATAFNFSFAWGAYHSPKSLLQELVRAKIHSLDDFGTREHSRLSRSGRVPQPEIAVV
jgi:hypothetical protein